MAEKKASKQEIDAQQKAQYAQLMEAIQKEIELCKHDYVHYAKKWCKLFDIDSGTMKPFVLFQQQQELVDILLHNRFTAIEKSRQSGISTTTSMFIACYAMFHGNQKINIIAHKKEGAVNFLEKVKEFIKSRPPFMGSDANKSGMVYIERDSTQYLKLSNRSEVRAFAASTQGMRSFTSTFLIFDECAFIPNADELYNAAYPTISTGGRCIMLSTPNGQDALFYSTIKAAKNGENSFKVKQIYWWRDTRYNKGLLFHPDSGEGFWEEDVLAKRKSETIVPRDEAHAIELFDKGYIPVSPWFYQSYDNAQRDRRKMAQEYMIDYLQSGDTFIPGEILNKASHYDLKEPINTAYDDKLRIYHEYVPGRKYTMGVDVSSGKSNDYSAFVIMDVETLDICATYKGIIKPDLLAGIINTIGCGYGSPMVVVDMQGGYGATVVNELKHLNYRNIYRASAVKHNLKNILKSEREFYDPGKEEDMIDGLMITVSNRNYILETLKAAITKGEFKISCKYLLEEFKTFTYDIKNKPNHSRTGHDDIIFATAMTLYIIRHEMAQLTAMQTFYTGYGDWMFTSVDRLPSNQARESDPDDDTPIITSSGSRIGAPRVYLNDHDRNNAIYGSIFF